MAEEANTRTSADQPQDTAEPHGEAQQTDWESKYREAVSHSREWEKRAKDNKAAADELQQLNEANMSEQQKAEKQTAEWRAQVAEESGLPANLITGSTLEEM